MMKQDKKFWMMFGAVKLITTILVFGFIVYLIFWLKARTG